jgi:hypothetical protein
MVIFHSYVSLPEGIFWGGLWCYLNLNKQLPWLHGLAKPVLKRTTWRSCSASQSQFKAFLRTDGRRTWLKMPINNDGIWWVKVLWAIQHLKLLVTSYSVIIGVLHFFRALQLQFSAPCLLRTEAKSFPWGCHDFKPSGHPPLFSKRQIDPPARRIQCSAGDL